MVTGCSDAHAASTDVDEIYTAASSGAAHATAASANHTRAHTIPAARSPSLGRALEAARLDLDPFADAGYLSLWHVKRAADVKAGDCLWRLVPSAPAADSAGASSLHLRLAAITSVRLESGAFAVNSLVLHRLRLVVGDVASHSLCMEQLTPVWLVSAALAPLRPVDPLLLRRLARLCITSARVFGVSFAW